MKIAKNAKRLRIYSGERDKIGSRPLFEVIVEEARRQGLAGSTVLRGVTGYGANSRVHTSKILRLSEDLPMVIEIVDDAEKIDRFFPFLDEHLREGLVTVEDATVMIYRHSNGEKKR
jgi:uncharacterized protein